MILSEYLSNKPDRLWELSRQLGVRHAITNCSGVAEPWKVDGLREIQRRFAEAGITVYGLEGDQIDMRRIKLGLDGRDEDIERFCGMLRAMGELGIGMLCYNWMAVIGWHRTRADVPARGGAYISRFDADEVPAELTEVGEVLEERLWDSFAYFARRVMPVAEEAGVQMAAHPDDPPLPSLRGVGRIFYCPENYERAMALAPSPMNGVTFCQANFRLMAPDRGGECAAPVGVDGSEAGTAFLTHWARRFGEQRKLFFVHFRDVRGDASRFEETFHDDGPTDMAAMLKTYHEAGFEGPLRVDHVPTMAGEDNLQPGYANLGRLYAIGYVRGILDANGIPVA